MNSRRYDEVDSFAKMYPISRPENVKFSIFRNLINHSTKNRFLFKWKFWQSLFLARDSLECFTMLHSIFNRFHITFPGQNSLSKYTQHSFGKPEFIWDFQSKVLSFCRDFVYITLNLLFILCKLHKSIEKSGARTHSEVQAQGFPML